jgi:imidazolonepropionase-like amidohydrolase
MAKKSTLGLFLTIQLLLPLAAKTSILRHVAVYLPVGTLQADSYIVLRDAKIEHIGLMADVPKQVFDSDLDLKGFYIYPALIDACNTALFDKRDKRPGSEQVEARGEPAVDKNTRKPLDERRYFITRKASQQLKLNRAELDKMIAKGFAVAHVVPEGGIMSGSSAVVALGADSPRETVLVPDLFSTLAISPNSNAYPVTLAGIYAELLQLRADSHYQRDMLTGQYADPGHRRDYRPELEALSPVFAGEKRLLISARNYTEQRIAERVSQALNLSPVLVLNSELWRRSVDPKFDLILPLSFKAPAASIHAQQGEAAKKQVEDTLYPQKIADFIKSRPAIVIAPPDNGDYVALFKNIRTLIKLGVNEDKLVRALTANPATLLGIQRLTGTLEAGKLANLIAVSDTLFAEKALIRKVWVDGRLFEFDEEKKGEPPVGNLSGAWSVKVQGAMGDMEMKMKLTQTGNSFSGQLVSPKGTIIIENGFISGKHVTFTCDTTIMSESVSISFSGILENSRLEGKMNLGALGEATVTAIPDAGGNGGAA